jgi:hypothetical protein
MAVAAWASEHSPAALNGLSQVHTCNEERWRCGNPAITRLSNVPFVLSRVSRKNYQAQNPFRIEIIVEQLVLIRVNP